MKILSVTSECVPLVKTGGLADVAGALPEALRAAFPTALHDIVALGHARVCDYQDAAYGQRYVARLQRVLLDPQADDDNAWVRKGRALFEAQAGRLDDAEAFREGGADEGREEGMRAVRL